MELDQQAGYRFTVRFDDPGIAPLITDEPPPLGTGTGPNPARLLGAAVANCLSASLLFALSKHGNDPAPMHAVVTVLLGRNPQGRTRVLRIAVEITLGVTGDVLKHADRALAQFEDFCVVTQSVRAGIDVDVSVYDSAGNLLSDEPAAHNPA